MMKIENPLVSLLVPVFGVEKYIEKCARSLFEQTYANIEYVFVNDQTIDKSIDILKRVMNSYPQRKESVRIIEHKKNRGLSAARNTAINACSGTYLMHVDSDDYLLSNQAVEVLVQSIVRENADIAICDYTKIFEQKNEEVKQVIPKSKDELIHRVLTRKTPTCIWASLYKASLYKENKVCHIEGVNMGEDYAVKPILLYYAKKIVHVELSLYGYLQTNSCAMTYSFKTKDVTDINIAIRNLKTFFSSLPDSAKYNFMINDATMVMKARNFARWGGSTKRKIEDFKLISSMPELIPYRKSSLSFKEKANLAIAKYCGYRFFILSQYIFHLRHIV